MSDIGDIGVVAGGVTCLATINIGPLVRYCPIFVLDPLHSEERGRKYLAAVGRLGLLQKGKGAIPESHGA